MKESGEKKGNKSWNVETPVNPTKGRMDQINASKSSSPNLEIWEPNGQKGFPQFLEIKKNFGKPLKPWYFPLQWKNWRNQLEELGETFKIHSVQKEGKIPKGCSEVKVHPKASEWFGINRPKSTLV